MPTVETQLRELARHLDTEFTDVEVEELTPPGIASPIGPPGRYEPSRRRLPPWAVAVGTAVLVLIFFGGVALLTRTLGGESQPPVAPTEESLIDLEFGDLPPFFATYTVDAGVINVSYGGPGVGFRLVAVEGRPDLLGVTRSAPSGGLCDGGISVWDGEQLGIYTGCEPPEEEFFVESTGADFEPLGYLGWHTRWTADGESWQEFCRGVDYQDLPIETVAGRSAVHIRCVGTRDDIELWIDANTGLVLKLAGSRGGPGWPGDFEATIVEYDPAFASDIFLVEAPSGVGDARREQPAIEESAPSEPIELTAADFLRALSNIGLAEGEIAPPFSGPLLDGGTFDLIQLRGQPILVMLWAEWCPPCVDGLAPFQAVADQWADGVEFVSVLTLESTPEIAAGIVEEQGFTVPVVIDLTDSLWNPIGIPVFVLLDAEGRAIAGYVGTPGTETLDFLLEQFLG
ncbi:MAG: redoxin domain-containing protein [Acidobacteria bacterium]|nr:redoxin domain-containing protein [Acidobacteriota bacterium]